MPGIQDGLKAKGQTILTPLVSLDTPGKATVEVVIPADPVCEKHSKQSISIIFLVCFDKYFFWENKKHC